MSADTTWISSIYTFVDNTEPTNIETKRRLLKNKYYAEYHHWYLANYSIGENQKEVIIIIHKENEELFNKQEILKALTEKEGIRIEEIQLKKFW